MYMGVTYYKYTLKIPVLVQNQIGLDINKLGLSSSVFERFHVQLYSEHREVMSLV